jgi:hypothetical protein
MNYEKKKTHEIRLSVLILLVEWKGKDDFQGNGADN